MIVKSSTIAFCCFFSLADCAWALVGGAQLATDDLSRAVVGVVGPRNAFCTATAIAHDLLLTAGHCVQPGAKYTMQYRDSNGLRKLSDIVEVERHPNFNSELMRTTGATADLAFLKLANSLPENIAIAVLGMQQPPIWPGDRFTVIGEGVGVRGLHETGTSRAATLVVTGPYSVLQIRLIDPSGKQSIGACGGDSGSPVFRAETNSAKIIGVVSWAVGFNRTKGCGGVTGVTPLSPYKNWITETLNKLGSEAAD
jgi:secreted trypsin-like serine protease